MTDFELACIPDVVGFYWTAEAKSDQQMFSNFIYWDGINLTLAAEPFCELIERVCN